MRRDANEMYLVPVPDQLVGMDFVAAANVFLPDRTSMHEDWTPQNPRRIESVQQIVEILEAAA